MTKDEALKLLVEVFGGGDWHEEIVDSAWADNANNAIAEAKKVLAQPPEERNFCPRCGKRAGKNAWDVHTCSLPEEKNT